MQGKGRSRRRGVNADQKRRISGLLSVMLTVTMTLNTPIGVLGFGITDAFASVDDAGPGAAGDAGEKVEVTGADGGHAEAEIMEEGWMTAKNAEYRPGARQDVDIYVIAEDNDVAPGNVSTMRLYLKNNTGSAVTDGTLSFSGSRIKKEDGSFLDISGTAGSMDAVDIDPDVDDPDLLEALEAEAYAREFGKEEDEAYELTGLRLEPGQLHEIEFEFYTDDGARDGKAYVDFKFQGEGTDGKIRSSEKFYYSIGLPTVNIELLDGQALETGLQHQMTIWMTAPSWTDYETEVVQIPITTIQTTTAAETETADLVEDESKEEDAETVETSESGEETVETSGSEEEAVEAVESGEDTLPTTIIEDEPVPVEDLTLDRSAVGAETVYAPLMRTADTVIPEAEPADEGTETDPVEAIEETAPAADVEETEETAPAADAEEMAPTADVEETAPVPTEEGTEAPAETESTSLTESAQAETTAADVQTAEAMAIKESKVSYTVEVFGTEFKRFRPTKTTEAEDIGWITCLYELAEDARPGVYYGKVTANGTWNSRSFTTSQGFLFEITGEGTITLKGRLDGMSVEVSGPVSSFPEARKLELSIEALSQEEQEAVEEAMDGEGTPYTTFSLSLLADGETADTQGPVTVKISDRTIKENTAPIVAAQEAQTAAAASIEEQAAEPQEEAEPGQAAAQKNIRKGPGAAGKMIGRALLAEDGSLIVEEKKEEETEETVIADSRAAELILMKVDTRSAQAQGLEAAITESGALQAETSEIMAVYAVAREGEEQEEPDEPGLPEEIEEKITRFKNIVEEIRSGYINKGYGDRDILLAAIQMAQDEEEEIKENAAEEVVLKIEKEISQACSTLEWIWKDLEGKRDGFKVFLEGRYEPICSENQDITDEEWSDWTERWNGILDILEELSGYKENYAIGQSEYDQYCSELYGFQDERLRAACREFSQQIESISIDYVEEDEELSTVIQSVKQWILFWDDYRGYIQVDETKEMVETAWRSFQIKRAEIFLSWADGLLEATSDQNLENGKYAGYEGYQDFRRTIKEFQRLLQKPMRIGPDDVQYDMDLEAFLEDLTLIDQDMVQKVTEKVKALENRCEELAEMAVYTVEAKATYERFLKEFGQLVADHDAFWEYVNEGEIDPDNEAIQNWQWSAKDRKGILERIEGLFKLLDSLPTGLYELASEQREKLMEIRSKEAVRELERIAGELQAMYRRGETNSQKYTKLVEDAYKLYPYIQYIYVEDVQELWKLQEKIELLEILATGDTPWAVADFLNEADKLTKILGDETRLQEMFFKDSDILAYKLLLAYEKVEEVYNGLSDVVKDLVPEVEKAWNALSEAWDPISEKYSGAFEELKENKALCNFLKQVYALEGYYNEVKEQHKDTDGYPWELKLACEECLWEADGLSNIEDNVEFENAKAILKAIDQWILENWPEEEDLEEAGEYTITAAWGEDVFIQETTIGLAEEFIELVQVMDEGLQKIQNVIEMDGWYKRVKELEERLDGSDSGEEDKENIQMELDQLWGIFPEILDEWSQKIDLIAKCTEYDGWHGLLGGSVETVTAWEGNGVSDPMEFNIDAMTANGLYLQVTEGMSTEAMRKMLDDALKTLKKVREDLSVRAGVAEEIVVCMSVWQAAEGDTKVGAEYLFGGTKEYPQIQDHVDAIPPSLENAQTLIENLQTFEGTLQGIQSIQQRMREYSVQMESVKNVEVRNAIEERIHILAEGVTFLAKYVSYNGWHGLGGGDSRIHVPMGWPQYGCSGDHVWIDLSDMTAEGLGLTDERRMDLDAIDRAIDTVSRARSLLGAWQNTSEHVIILCELKMAGIPLIGNAFDRSVEGHHIPLKLTGQFDQVYSEMKDRVYELDIKLENTSDEDSKAAIKLEQEKLKDGLDVLIDLLLTDVVVTPQVRLEDDAAAWTDAVFITENETFYRYKLEYGVEASNTKNVCLVDHIENEDGTVFAGTVKGVVTGTDVQVYVRSSKPSGQDVEYEELPDGLQKETDEGRGGWRSIDPENYEDWPYVTSIAFYFGDRVFGNIAEIGDVKSVSVEILMASVYGGKPGCKKVDMPEDGYKLYNTCSVYQAVGDDPGVMIERGGSTQVVLSYKTEDLPIPIRLPDTGGPGLLQFNRFGWLLLLLALMMAGTEARYYGAVRNRVETGDGPEERRSKRM